MFVEVRALYSCQQEPILITSAARCHDGLARGREPHSQRPVRYFRETKNRPFELVTGREFVLVRITQLLSGSRSVLPLWRDAWVAAFRR